MSRILAQSITADLLARLFSAALFLLLMPFIFLLARRIPTVPTRAVPFSAPASERPVDRTFLKRRP